MKSDQQKRCELCGATFQCGPAAGKIKCWCDELPRINPPLGSGHDCLCPDCLRAAIKQNQSSVKEVEKK